MDALFEAVNISSRLSRETFKILEIFLCLGAKQIKELDLEKDHFLRIQFTIFCRESPPF